MGQEAFGQEAPADHRATDFAEHEEAAQDEPDGGGRLEPGRLEQGSENRGGRLEPLCKRGGDRAGDGGLAAPGVDGWRSADIR